MRTIAIYNPKGGAGKSVTAANLAVSLAAARRRVLLIDLDEQGATTAVTIGPDGREPNIFHALFQNVEIAAAAAQCGERLHVMASDARMVQAERLLEEQAAPDLRLRRLLQQASVWDVCLLDVPGRYSVLARNALLAASHVLVPVNPDINAFNTANDTWARAGVLYDAYDRAPAEMAVLLTAYRGLANDRAVESMCEGTWNGQVLKSRIRFTAEVPKLATDFRTVRERAAGTAREDYRALANEITKRWLR